SALTGRVAESREKRFASIIQEYGSVISGICFSYATNADDLQDLRQDIMINIWKGLESFRGESAISTWIYRVALNTCVSTVRKRSKALSTVPIEKVAERETETDEDMNERIELLHSLISTLSPIDKGVITMWLDERSYEEIAEVIGISRNNVAIRINRIKQKLANKVEK
ncbi:MAG: sigma-70 family RNA polymerase sigma factor, partial [Muribaculaceae bacterium]|nr:sigma-70 family RNA polymerase sigma factor [Muribaculaceae bacterium]